ncbi:saccharopine dehydrogenase [Radiomyces spectabilis]|uniref:saccharopine dehydrogenase n=1 Tax=Radiomyces spectabilis TaxID=64574 RepID=UPI00221FCFDD|nr:saccharopine dehydrogenase [Radiomyces spectabilis]KAI8388865.1 saccharopine dehydrogenase [Radiomyces spectabilis]
MSEKKILLLGSGYVAAPAAEYIVRRPENKLTIASRRLENAEALAKQFPGSTAVSCDITNQQAIEDLVAQHDLVISLIPYIYHADVIKAAVKHKKNVVTTSYVSPAMMEYDQAAKDAGIIVMNEIGLDPGIDHLYAVRTIEEVHREGGKMNEFISFCGGLPAPENSNNPFGYKFSWSARGVLLALKNTARYLENGKVVEVSGPALMDSARTLNTGYPGYAFVAYGNRDSTPYDKRYNIPEASTIIRGTIRYDGFPQFVKALVSLGFLDDQEQPHLLASAAEISWKDVVAKAAGTTDTTPEGLEAAIIAKAELANHPRKAAILDGMKWLGFFSDVKVTRRGNLLDTLCATLEEKMQYEEGERDMVFLQHRFEIELKDGTKQTRTSTLVEYGKVGGYSAMAKTVGVPCGIAVQLILDGKITQTGVIAPMTSEINEPIIELLEKEGIGMVEKIL